MVDILGGVAHPRPPFHQHLVDIVSVVLAHVHEGKSSAASRNSALQVLDLARGTEVVDIRRHESSLAAIVPFAVGVHDPKPAKEIAG